VSCDKSQTIRTPSSRWKFMKAFHPSLFLVLSRLLENISVTTEIRETMDAGRAPTPPGRMPAHAIADSRNLFSAWQYTCFELELTTAVTSIKRIRDLLDSSTVNDCDLKGLTDEL